MLCDASKICTCSTPKGLLNEFLWITTKQLNSVRKLTEIMFLWAENKQHLQCLSVEFWCTSIFNRIWAELMQCGRNIRGVVDFSILTILTYHYILQLHYFSIENDLDKKNPETYHRGFSTFTKYHTGFSIIQI